MTSLSDKVKKSFSAKFDVPPTITVKAPGRVNLLGEHTDYNGGFVLPAAIDKAIYVSVAPRKDRQLSLFSMDLDRSVEANIDSLKPTSEIWANYILGVVQVIIAKGNVMDHGFNLIFGGDIPQGAGLSSSAAVECGTAMALNELFKIGLSKKQLALYSQEAEHTFAGVKCGIMDMYASIFGRKNQVISLDCRSITHEYFHFPFENYDLILFNTMVKHSLADTAYNKRRESCEQGLRVIKKAFKSVKDLRDVNYEQLLSVKSQLSEEVFSRCSYIIGETTRMKLAKEALEYADVRLFGQQMNETHLGLRDLYEVSCIELDFLASTAESIPQVVGARMMGGGFGGCTINLVEKMYKDSIVEKVSAAYLEEFGFKPEVYGVQLEDGCVVLS